LSRRGIARISADVLFFMLQKKIGLEIHVPGVNLLLQVSQFFTFITFTPFIYPIYWKKIKSKILMRRAGFMAQVNYCKRGQGPCEFNLPVQQE